MIELSQRLLNTHGGADMEKEKLSDIINKKVLFIVFAALGVLAGAFSIVLLIVEHKIYSNGAWYMLTVCWFLLAGFFVYRYIKTVKDEKKEAQMVAEYKEKYKIK